MLDHSDRVRDYARFALAGIRLFNGVAGLFAPAALARRLGVDPDASPGVLYALRLFGVRTILIGLELLLPEREVRNRSVRIAPIIHASDVASALLTGAQPQFPRRAATTTALISTVNVILSLLMQPRAARKSRLRGG